MGGRRDTRTIIACCLLVALTLVVLDARGSALGGRLRGMVGAIAGPAERAIAAGSAPVRGAAALSRDDQELDATALAEQNAQLRQQLGVAARGELDRALAEEFATLTPPLGYRQIPADVIALTGPLELERAVTIDRGSRAGVVAGAAVIAVAGLVGVVDSVAPDSATVRLITDQAASVGARVVASKEAGVYRGSGRADLGNLQLLDPLGHMAVGDLVVTLGSRNGQPFPKGLPIGRISELTGSAISLDRRAAVTTAVDGSTMERVAVLAVEPAAADSPTPDPSAPDAAAAGTADSRP